MAWNKCQRKIWNFSPLSSRTTVKWVSTSSTFLSQIHAKTYNFIQSLLVTDNNMVRFIGRLCLASERSLISQNMAYINQMVDTNLRHRISSHEFDRTPSQDDGRFSRMIREINFAIDGFLDIDICYSDCCDILSFNYT